MADKRISQLIERTDIANNDVLPIVASAAITTNKVTVSTLQDWMQDNLDLGVTSVGITVGTSGTDVNVTGSPITSSGNITINIPTASATNRGLLSSADWTTFNNKQDSGNFVTLDTTQTITGAKTFTNSGSSSNIIVNHTSGSGIALDITKGGNGEGLRVNKTGGSGNAVTIIGGDLSAEAAKFSDLVEISANAGGAAVYLRGRSSDDLSQLFFFGSTPGSVQNYIQSRPTSLEINSWNDTPIIFRTNVGASGGARLTISGAGNVTLTGSLSGTSALFSSTMRIGTINNGVGDFITTDANGVLTKRTAAQTLSDIGGQASLTNPVTGTGAAGQVAFWTGAGTQSGDGDLVWDNVNKRLSITNNNSAVLSFVESGSASSAIESSGALVYDTGNTFRHIFRTNFTEKWSILNTGIFQSNGAQTIQTSTGNLTLATGGGNGNILLSPNGTGNVGIGTTSPSAKLDVNGSTGIIGRFRDSTNGIIDIKTTGSTNSNPMQIDTLNRELSIAINSVERLRITSDGFARLSASSGGIQFNGDTAAANALDDYEEGTWTMGISFGGNAVGVGYFVNTGTYTKIGRQVTVNGLISLTSKGSSTGDALITGLPFANGSGFQNSSITALLGNTVTFANIMAGSIGSGDNAIKLREQTEAGVQTALTDANFANNSDITVSMTYFV